MGRLGEKAYIVLFTTLVCLLAFAPFDRAEAKSINYGVIAPHEFNLPIDYEGFNIFVEYAWFNNDRKAWDVADGSSDTLTSVSKYVRFWKIDALPKVGFLWEVAIPSVGVIDDEGGVTGFGDPQVGLLSWVRPIPNLCIGAEWWFHVPFGDNELSSHAFDNDLCLVWDYQLGKFNFDGCAGVLLRGDRRHGGDDWDRGENVHANLRFAYAFSRNIEPFFSLDWQTDSAVNDKDSDLTIARGSDEIAMGGGLHFNFTPNLVGDIWYMKGVDGRNAVKTDAVYVKLAVVF